MKVYIKRKDGAINATGDYNTATKELTVMKGSIISGVVRHSEKFKGADAIEKSRTLFAENGVVTQNVIFKSASTAANFVTGSSTNGLVAWKDENGVKLKELIVDFLKREVE